MNKIVEWLLKRQIVNTTKKIEQGGGIPSTLKSSEFWVGLFTSVMIVLSDQIGLSGAERDNLIKLALTFITSRGAVKIFVKGIVKKGVFTSEFVLLLVSTILTCFGNVFGVSQDVVNQATKLFMTIIGSRAVGRVVNGKIIDERCVGGDNG